MIYEATEEQKKEIARRNKEKEFQDHINKIELGIKDKQKELKRLANEYKLIQQEMIIAGRDSILQNKKVSSVRDTNDMRYIRDKIRMLSAEIEGIKLAIPVLKNEKHKKEYIECFEECIPSNLNEYDYMDGEKLLKHVKEFNK